MISVEISQAFLLENSQQNVFHVGARVEKSD
jgi:hypothetical protein